MVKLKDEVGSEKAAAEKQPGSGSGERDVVSESPSESNRRLVQVSGLKFDVELRNFEVGQDGERKRDVWFHML